MKRLIFTFGLVVWVLLTMSSNAATIYESATLGPTGITKEQVVSQSVLAANVTSFSFVGVRFYVGQEVRTTRIGGHFVGGFSDTSFFGVLVRLTDSLDFPNSPDLSTSDVIGSTRLSFPETSNEVFNDLSAILEPGWHAVAFGSGSFGASGRGAAPTNNLDVGSPSYIFGQPEEGWLNASDFQFLRGGFRLVVEGQFIPEPSSRALLLFAVACTVSLRRRQ